MKQSIFTIYLFFTFFSAHAQVGSDTELYRSILAKDSLLFDIGFNTCDIAQFENLTADDFVFYHDKSGISDKKKFLSDLRNGLCGNPGNYQSRRELLKESVKVYALYNQGELYGAIQEGKHQFFEKQTGQPEQFGSSAKFTHVWQLVNGDWKLTKVLSFEHKP